jgi:hypothetical protein
MMQAEDDSLELDDEDFLGGLSPEDESTPLHLSRGKSLLIRQDEQSQSPSASPPSSDRSRKRKRDEQIQVPRSPVVVVDNTLVDTIEDTPNPTPALRDPTPDPDPSDETPQPLRLADVLSQTMLPPASSPLSSVITSNGTPNVVIPHGPSGRKAKNPSNLSTAVLQERLLPRRRQRRHRSQPAGEFDVPSDESDDGMHDAASGDEDELSSAPVRRSRRSVSSKPKPLGNAGDKSKLNNQKPRKGRSKSAQRAKSAEAPRSTTKSRSRRSGDVNKENEQRFSSPSSSPLSSPPDSEASDSEAEVAPRRIMSAELRAAVAKFAEIDKWEMEFEDVSASEV